MNPVALILTQSLVFDRRTGYVRDRATWDQDGPGFRGHIDSCYAYASLPKAYRGDWQMIRATLYRERAQKEAKR